MGRPRIFRPFNTRAHQQAKAMAGLRRRVDELRTRVQAGTLTDDDYKLLARMGPKTHHAIGYAPKVTLA